MRITVIILLLTLAGCTRFGHVNQGQVVEYQKAKGMVTLISDSNYRDRAHPRFDVLPPVTIYTPDDRTEMGPEPEAGGLLRLDLARRVAVIYDSRAQDLRTVPFTIVAEQETHVSRARQPLIDGSRGTVTLYAAGAKKIITLAVAEPYLSLGEDACRTGDEIRYYYKDPGRALRLMNVTKTDLNKAGK